MRLMEALSDDRRTLAANVTALTSKAGMGIQRLAKDIGIGTETLQRAQQGYAGVRVDTLEKLAAYYQIATWRLLMPDLGATMLDMGQLDGYEGQIIALHRRMSGPQRRVLLNEAERLLGGDFKDSPTIPGLLIDEQHAAPRKTKKR